MLLCLGSNQEALFLFFKSFDNVLRQKIEDFANEKLPEPEFNIGKIFNRIDSNVVDAYKILPDKVWMVLW